MPRKRPVEYSILYTATLCLLASGAVMVYSASSAESLLSGPGDPAYYLKRYVMFGLAGLVLLHLASRHGLKVIRGLTPLLLASSLALNVAIMIPGSMIATLRAKEVASSSGVSPRMSLSPCREARWRSTSPAMPNIT